jgi:hypothetical protein
MARKGVEIIGAAELARDFRKGVAHLARETREANRTIGRRIVSKLSGAQSGGGQGSRPEAVPMRTTVAIEVGYPGREVPVAPWGRDQSGAQGPRPYILGAVLSSSSDVERLYEEAVAHVIHRISDQ